MNKLRAKTARGAILNPAEYLRELYPGPDVRIVPSGGRSIDGGRVAGYTFSGEYKNSCAMYAIAAVIAYYAGRAPGFEAALAGVTALYDGRRWPGGRAPGDYYLRVGGYARFARACLRLYGLRLSARSSLFSWRAGVRRISEGRPVLLNIAGGFYRDHTVTAYGWETYTVELGRRRFRARFFKVRDGYSTEDRYVYMNSAGPTYVTQIY